MISRRNSAFLLAAALAGVALPAFSQSREAPESLLPPGFGDPGTLPPPEEPRPQPTRPPAEAPPPGFGPSPPPAAAQPPRIPPTSDAAQQDLAELPRPERRIFEIPAGARRPTDMVGVLEPGAWGLGSAAFGRADGRFLAGLMRRMDAPLPSRWTSMLLRRALLSRVAAPPNADPVDFVAERAWLLLRMGEADAARMLVQAVDTPDHTRRMVEVAAQVALATSDVAGLCPLVAPAKQFSDHPSWPMAEAMCAALEGEAARAGQLIDQARRRGGAGPVDVALAEKVVGAGTDARRAVTIQWEEVPALDPWRFGLASATGMEIPANLIDRATPAMRAWYARAPMVPIENRLAAASTAAALGVFSSNSLVELHSLALDRADPAEVSGTIGARLRTAWTHREAGERLSAMRGLWNDGEGPDGRYAHWILTAGAAARVAPSADKASDAEDLIASMLAAGMDGPAARWAEVIGSGRASQRAWAMLALASAEPAVDLSRGRVEAFANADDSVGRRRTRLLIAALAGLGRLEDSRLAAAHGLDLNRENSWTRAIDQAARLRQPGSVALLAGTGMQTGSWAGVPPEHLFRILRALRAVGLDYEARMIAAEAAARS